MKKIILKTISAILVGAFFLLGSSLTTLSFGLNYDETNFQKDTFEITAESHPFEIIGESLNLHKQIKLTLLEREEEKHNSTIESLLNHLDEFQKDFFLDVYENSLTTTYVIVDLVALSSRFRDLFIKNIYKVPIC